MAKILITGYLSINDSSGRVARIIASWLSEGGYQIIESAASEYVASGFSSSSSIKDVDVAIVVISKELLDYSYLVKDYERTRIATTLEGGLFLPIYMPDLEAKHIPLEISSIQGIFLEGDTEFHIRQSFDKIERNISQAMARKQGEQEIVNEIKEKIEHSAAEYIKETLNNLESRERSFRHSAFTWYSFGFFALLMGAFLAYSFATDNLRTVDNWSITVFFTVKSIFIILLLVAASKYSFNLGKSYMTEALKISDRAHAISFGKFYLQIFNTKLDSAEIKEIFRDWNINDRSLPSKDKDDESFDPMILEKSTKFLEKIAEIVERMRGKANT